MPSRVLIAEDDAAVARLHRRIVERFRQFEVVGIAGSGEAVLAAIGATSPDLLLLDLGLRGSDGVVVMRSLRQSRAATEVIAVTANGRASTVRELAQLGAVDYLVKPFAPERLERALNAFLSRRAALAGHAHLDQSQIDRAWTAGGAGGRRWLPKGLSELTLQQVRGVLLEAEAPLTATAVADLLGLARVTARRYLEFLEVNRQVVSEAVAKGPGRPHKFYELSPDLVDTLRDAKPGEDSVPAR